MAIVPILAGCGGGGTAVRTEPSHQPDGPVAKAHGQQPTTSVASRLHPAPAPAGWRSIRIPDGATVAYPPSWKRIRSDVDTGTAVLLGPDDQIRGYLNLTPRQGEETLANWSRFRIDHNGEEGDRAIVTLGRAGGLRFRTGRGSCVRDSYTTKTAHHYTELACIVAGPTATTVVVGAAPTKSWPRISPLLERAISTMTT
jgi:hypothetical protein